MTHDELLEQVNEYISSECDCESCNFVNGPYKALRAVVALHKPVMAWTGAYDYNDAELWAEQCDYCSGNGFSQTYPCRNIQAIEKELG